MFKMCDLASNIEAEIVRVDGAEEVRERLMELGLFLGAFVKKVGQAPFGGPQIYQIGSGVIALRQSEAECISVKKLN